MNWVDGLFALGVAIAKDMKENRSSNYESNDYDEDDYETDYENNYKYDRFSKAVEYASNNYQKKRTSIEKHAREDYRKHLRNLSDESLYIIEARTTTEDNEILLEMVQEEKIRRGLY